MKGFVLLVRIAACLLLAATTHGLAQSDLEIEGRVIDPRGRAAAGAQVTLRIGETVAVAIADERGGFRFQHLAPGDYSIEVMHPGFAVAKRSIDLRDSVRALEVQLEIATQQQSVVVTASPPEFAQQSTIERRDIQDKGAYDLAQYLRDEPGISAVRRGPINLDPNVRGLQETELGLFVNGTRTFPAGPARMDSGISHISPHIVQSLRAVKGPYALSSGAGAMSALVVDTFRSPFYSPDFQAHGRLGYRYGENAVTNDGYGLLYGGNERVRFHLFYNRRSGNDYRSGDGQLIPGDYSSDDFNWNIGFQLNPRTVLSYTGGYQEQNDIDYAGRILDASYFLTRSHAWELSWNRPGGLFSAWHAQIYVNRKDHLMNNDEKPTALPMQGRIPPFGIRVDLPTESNTLGGDFWGLMERGPWDFKLGFDFYNRDQTASRTISRRGTSAILFQDIVWPDAQINDQGVYGQLIYETERIQVGGTLRLDWVQASAGETSPFFQRNTTGPLDRDESNLSAALNGRLKLHSSWTLTAGIGRAVRTADVLERYSDRFPSTKFQISAEFLGSPRLDPEKSLEVSVGSEWNASGRYLLAEVFLRRIDDYITVRADPSIPKRLPLSPPTVYRYINGTQALFYGAEISAGSNFGDHLTARASLAWIWAEDDLFDEPALGIAPLHGTLAWELHTVDRSCWLDLSVTLVDAQRRAALSRFEQPTPGYALFDLRGHVALPGRWNLQAGIENLGDRTYANHLNALNPFTGVRIPEIGRNFYAGLEYEF